MDSGLSLKSHIFPPKVPKIWCNIDSEIRGGNQNSNIIKNLLGLFLKLSLRSNSFSIPLGYSTIVYITPKVREIDSSAAGLQEAERGCRLSQEASNLNSFKIYTKEGCLLECKIEQAYKKCGCFPWNYPIIEVVKPRKMAGII